MMEEKETKNAFLDKLKEGLKYLREYSDLVEKKQAAPSDVIIEFGTYKLGDGWSEDFDYEGLLQTSLLAKLSWGVDNLTKLHYSFDDNNYHTLGRLLSEVVKNLILGGSNPEKQAAIALDKFKSAVILELAENEDQPQMPKEKEDKPKSKRGRKPKQKEDPKPKDDTEETGSLEYWENQVQEYELMLEIGGLGDKVESSIKEELETAKIMLEELKN